MNIPSLLQGSPLLVHLRGVHQGQLHLLVEVLVEVLMREQLVIEVNDKIYMWSAIWYTWFHGFVLFETTVVTEVTHIDRIRLGLGTVGSCYRNHINHILSRYFFSTLSSYVSPMWSVNTQVWPPSSQVSPHLWNPHGRPNHKVCQSFSTVVKSSDVGIIVYFIGAESEIFVCCLSVNMCQCMVIIPIIHVVADIIPNYLLYH